MAVRVNIELDDGAISRFLSPTGDIGVEVRRVTARVANLARARAPVDTGALRASIRSTVETRGRRIEGTVYSQVDYSYYVNAGTVNMRAQPFLWEALQQGAADWAPRRTRG